MVSVSGDGVRRNRPLGLMTPTEAPLWWEFFDDLDRTDALTRTPAAHRAVRSWADSRADSGATPSRPRQGGRRKPRCNARRERGESRGHPMTFASVLFARPDDRAEPLPVGAPDCFTDLNLDQIVDAVTADWTDYDLKPFFHAPLRRTDAIRYRHEVFRDLENPAVFACVRSFAQRTRDVRGHLNQAHKLRQQYQKEAWFLHAAAIYCDAVERFAGELCSLPLKSRGVLAFSEYLTHYAAGRYFSSLAEETAALAGDLSGVRYCVLIKDNAFTVRDYHEESDYSVEIEETFEKFKQGAAKDYRVSYRSSPDMNHIEAKILDFVAQLNPDLFSRLDRYRTRHADFVDATVATFDREIHFYVAYLEHAAKFKRSGLRFCYPRISSQSKEVHDYEGFDLALAGKLIDGNGSIVCNDFFLKGRERIIVVTGPNQGGKTTFARTFGQLHYLASIGCPVPGREAQLLLFDRLFTHFEREEKVENLRGKLEDDLVRIHAILEQATSRSVVVMNEIFTSTTLQDEIFLSRRVMERLAALDLLCVWVTFANELTSFSERTVSMVSTIVPDNPTLRTFKIVRRPADGLAYAMAIAEKYQLTRDSIRRRIKA
jgi:DNA mismatch repair protein MutS